MIQKRDPLPTKNILIGIVEIVFKLILTVILIGIVGYFIW